MVKQIESQMPTLIVIPKFVLGIGEIPAKSGTAIVTDPIVLFRIPKFFPQRLGHRAFLLIDFINFQRLEEVQIVELSEGEDVGLIQAAAFYTLAYEGTPTNCILIFNYTRQQPVVILVEVCQRLSMCQ